MADADSSQTPSPAATNASAPAAPSAPSVATPAPSPQSAAAPAAAAPAVAADATPPATPAPAASTSTTGDAPASAAPSLLGTEPDAQSDAAPATEAPKDGEKPAEAPKDGEKPAEVKDGEKPVDAEKPPESTAELPKYEAFTPPENFQVDEKELGEFTTMLGELELAKGDHVKMQEFGQKAIEKVAALMATQQQRLTDHFIGVFNQTQADEQKALFSDPRFGAGDEKKYAAIGKDMANFLAKNGGTKEEVTAFRKFADERGVGNALPFATVLLNLKNTIERYQKENSTIVAGTKPASDKTAPGKGIMTALYGGTRRA